MGSEITHRYIKENKYMSIKAEQEKLQTKVKRILIEKPYTRNSDDLLYAEMLKSVATEKGISLADHSIITLLVNRKVFGLPSYESVGRARRKLQETDETLRADDNVEAMREMLAEEYKEWAIAN